MASRRLRLLSNIFIGSIALVAAVLGRSAHAAAAPGQTLVVHEWGTFTSLQDNAGATIGGINVDDEPVPPFVHRLGGLPIWTPSSMPASWSQGAPRCHPDVTLRLETPVVYFYPPGDPTGAKPFDFRASFVGGWLTEYFPAARSDNPRFPDRLTSAVRGRLEWRGIRLGAKTPAALPQTSERVWLAPRKVGSTTVTTADGQESEKYLFYRGVGHIDAPIVVSQQENRVAIALRLGDPRGRIGSIPRSWLVRVFPDGRLWYAAFDAASAVAGQVTIPLPADDAGASHTNLAALQTALRDALLEQGLFPDEAQAMLETWELSYFKSEGLRLFTLLPRTWIDHYLPISVSVPADITRVMLGRIELISPLQEENMAKIHRLAAPEFERLPVYIDILRDDQSTPPDKQRKEREQKLLSMLRDQRHTHAEHYQAFGREVPQGLKLYDSLGRFRDALLAHQLRGERDDVRRNRLRSFVSAFSACVPSE
jgi:hypothetical protein